MRVRATRLGVTGCNARKRGINIAGLFGAYAGREGVYYGAAKDPSITALLTENNARFASGGAANCIGFADPHATIPLLTVNQADRGLGLLLDRSKGLVRGASLSISSVDLVGAVDNGGGSYTIGPGATPRFYYTLGSLESTAVYEVAFRVAAVVGAAVIAADWCDTASWSFTPVVGQTYRFLARRDTYDATYRFLDAILTSGGGTSVTIDQITLSKIAGNHYVQPTATARGEITARVNLFEFTEDLANAYWTCTNTTPTAAATLSPTGTLTGTQLQSTGADSHVRTVTAVTTGASVAYKKFIKRGNHDWVRLTILSGGNEVQAWFNLATGTAGTSRGTGTGVLVSATILPAPNGWWECTLTGYVPGATGYQCVSSTAAADLSFARVASGIRYEWGADHRLEADAIPSIPSYQRVGAVATDYDSAGFPVRWRGQTDDFGKTRINPNGATKALVMWAGQKLSDAAIGVVVESSSDSGATNGTMALFAPNTAAQPRYMLRSRGTATAEAQDSTHPAPGRDVIRAQAGIATDVADLYVDGALAATSAADQGTGAYTEQDVFFWSRAGTSLFANVYASTMPLLMYMQSGDPGPTQAEIAQLGKVYGKAGGVTL